MLIEADHGVCAVAGYKTGCGEVELDSAFVFSETILIIGTSYIW